MWGHNILIAIEGEYVLDEFLTTMIQLYFVTIIITPIIIKRIIISIIMETTLGRRSTKAASLI